MWHFYYFDISKLNVTTLYSINQIERVHLKWMFTKERNRTDAVTAATEDSTWKENQVDGAENGATEEEDRYSPPYKIY